MPLLSEENSEPLTDNDIVKLNRIGVVTVMDLLNSATDLFQIAGVSHEKLIAAKLRFLTQYSSSIETVESYQYSGLKIYETSKAFTELNQLLGGGFYSREITEIFGSEASGKTHLCHQLAIDFASKGHNVLYIDADASFSGKRVARLIHNRQFTTEESESIFSRIRVGFLSTYHQLMALIVSIKEIMKTEASGPRNSSPDIMIIDSIVTPLATQFLSYSSPEDRDKLLTAFIQELNSLFTINTTLTIICVNTEANWFGLQWKNACSVSLCLKYFDGHTVVTVENSNRGTHLSKVNHTIIL